jgi:hypothetical protein
MANIEVPRTEVCKLLGLPSDVDEETLNAEFQKAITRLNAAKEAEAIAAAEARLVDEDKRIVAAAVAAGKFGPQRAQFWIDACKRDRANNRAVIASLHPVLADLAGIDPEAERVHAQIMARLGLAPQPPRTVAASGDPWAGRRERAVLDEVGLPVAQVPPPVLIQKGVDPADWTREQEYQYFSHKIGLGRRLGVPKPPAGDVYYQPSPSDPYRWDESAGRFVEKQPYKELP